MKKLLAFLILTLSALHPALAQQLPLYYGENFLSQYQSGTLRDQALITTLNIILKSGHIKNSNRGDTLVPSCNSAANCTEHRPLGYDGARKKLFGMLYLKTLTDGSYSVTDVYCDRQFTDNDFGGATFGPDMVPRSGNIINTEHTWPQSKFTGKYLKEMQKSDLHHLFPTDSEMNNKRGSLRFGNVASDTQKLKCPQNRLGRQENGEVVYEVPNTHKGNAARAIFYFVARYETRLTPTEEATLRQWDKSDPVDAQEYLRNGQIEQLQGDRNPFIDFTGLADHIDRFSK